MLPPPPLVKLGSDGTLPPILTGDYVTNTGCISCYALLVLGSK